MIYIVSVYKIKQKILWTHNYSW